MQPLKPCRNLQALMLVNWGAVIGLFTTLLTGLYSQVLGGAIKSLVVGSAWLSGNTNCVVLYGLEDTKFWIQEFVVRNYMVFMLDVTGEFYKTFTCDVVKVAKKLKSRRGNVERSLLPLCILLRTFLRTLLLWLLLLLLLLFVVVVVTFSDFYDRWHRWTEPLGALSSIGPWPTCHGQLPVPYPPQKQGFNIYKTLLRETNDFQWLIS